MTRNVAHKVCPEKNGHGFGSIRDCRTKLDTQSFSTERDHKGTYKYDAITFRDIFTPHPPFPTESSFGTLVGGAHLMMSYLNKHFEPVPILCAVDFCLESRPVNPIVYLGILIIFVLSIQNVQYVTVRIPSCR